MTQGEEEKGVNTETLIKGGERNVKGRLSEEIRKGEGVEKGTRRRFSRSSHEKERGGRTRAEDNMCGISHRACHPKDTTPINL